MGARVSVPEPVCGERKSGVGGVWCVSLGVTSGVDPRIPECPSCVAAGASGGGSRAAADM